MRTGIDGRYGDARAASGTCASPGRRLYPSVKRSTQRVANVGRMNAGWIESNRLHARKAMGIWVLVTYMLNPQAVVVVPGQDPQVISQLEFRTRELCDQARLQQAREDAKYGMTDQFVYKCVQRKT
jgi:hypothetical protein